MLFIVWTDDAKGWDKKYGIPSGGKFIVITEGGIVSEGSKIIYLIEVNGLTFYEKDLHGSRAWTQSW